MGAIDDVTVILEVKLCLSSKLTPKELGGICRRKGLSNPSLPQTMASGITQFLLLVLLRNQHSLTGTKLEHLLTTWRLNLQVSVVVIAWDGKVKSVSIIKAKNNSTCCSFTAFDRYDITAAACGFRIQFCEKRHAFAVNSLSI